MIAWLYCYSQLAFCKRSDHDGHPEDYENMLEPSIRFAPRPKPLAMIQLARQAVIASVSLLSPGSRGSGDGGGTLHKHRWIASRHALAML